jgi:hypothetical protein
LGHYQKTQEPAFFVAIPWFCSLVQKKKYQKRCQKKAQRKQLGGAVLFPVLPGLLYPLVQVYPRGCVVGEEEQWVAVRGLVGAAPTH